MSTLRTAALVLLAHVAMLLSVAPARAHTLSESHSSWQINGDSVRVQFIVPDLEAQRLSKSGTELPSNEQMGRYLADRLGASSDGEKCGLVEGPRALNAAPGYFRQELVFKCPQSKDIAIHSAVFYDLVPSHTNFARIQDGAGTFFEQLFTDDHREVEVSGGESESALKNAGMLKFIEMGIMHIFTGIDHMFLFTDIAAAFLVGEGLYWFLGRSVLL